ncbi:MAG: rhodanese-like domain-containing protein [Dehalococcoidia bacterium]|nr:rhodanese-like domain-containing protein [Dehalococcoidia bacterium]
MKRLTFVSVVLTIALMMTGACTPSSQPSSQASSSSTGTGTPVNVDGGTYWKLTPSQFRALTRSAGTFLVNVDNGYSGEIAETDLFLRADQAPDSLDLFPSDKDTRIAIYCSTAKNSPAVAAALVQAGYSNVFELEGGLVAWVQQGYPAINNPPNT